MTRLDEFFEAMRTVAQPTFEAGVDVPEFFVLIDDRAEPVVIVLSQASIERVRSPVRWSGSNSRILARSSWISAKCARARRDVARFGFRDAERVSIHQKIPFGTARSVQGGAAACT